MRVGTAMTVAAVLGLASAPAATADSSASANWAGYAAHRSGVHFHEVFAAWRQPTLTCTPGTPSYSAFWVGIGGYRLNAPALEQVGTEADCKSSGRSVSSAWFELVPAASRKLKMQVEPGDEIAASVTVTGHTVLVALQDRTRHRSVRRKLHASTVDVSSAEWIAEAPSNCTSSNSCETLPLADFGSTSFDVAGARTTSGRLGPITDKAWQTTKITLGSGGQQFAGYRPGTFGTATPSPLSNEGTSFSVTYAAVSAPSAPVFAAQRVRLTH